MTPRNLQDSAEYKERLRVLRTDVHPYPVPDFILRSMAEKMAARDLDKSRGCSWACTLGDKCPSLRR